jgi:predicted RNA-binding Zn ribbon-like protein
MPDTLTPTRAPSAPRWLELVGTRSDPPTGGHVEKLPDVQALIGWLDEHALKTEAEPTPADLASVRHVRNALRELTVARVQGRAAHPQAIDTVNAVIARATKTARHIVVPDPIEPGRLRRRVPDVDTALTLIVEETVDALSSERAADLRECEEPGCGEIFVDASGRRRWCSSLTCGTRARVRAHRARKAASGSGRVPADPVADA